MQNRLFYLLLVGLIFTLACGRKKVEQTRYLNFKANPSYVGSHPVAGLESNIYIIDKTSKMQFNIDMQGINETKVYKLHIHEADTTQPFGYSANPVIDLGTISNNLPTVSEISSKSFAEFTENLRGYYIVHDPDNESNDPTTLLIFSKIGSDW